MLCDVIGFALRCLSCTRSPSSFVLRAMLSTLGLGRVAVAFIDGENRVTPSRGGAG